MRHVEGKLGSERGEQVVPQVEAGVLPELTQPFLDLLARARVDASEQPHHGVEGLVHRHREAAIGARFRGQHRGRAQGPLELRRERREGRARHHGVEKTVADARAVQVHAVRHGAVRHHAHERVQVAVVRDAGDHGDQALDGCIGENDRVLAPHFLARREEFGIGCHLSPPSDWPACMKATRVSRLVPKTNRSFST